MKSFEERKAEVCRRRKIIAEKRKRRNKLLLCAAPVIIAVGIIITVNFSDIFSPDSAKTKAPTAAHYPPIPIYPRLK